MLGVFGQNLSEEKFISTSFLQTCLSIHYNKIASGDTMQEEHYPISGSNLSLYSLVESHNSIYMAFWKI